DPLKLTQGVLLVGKMGAGKTEFYFSVLSQKFYSRAVIHQVKVGDFVEPLLGKNDMLFSPYDKRGYLWDAMSESEGILKTFFENFANSVMGDKKDFFSSSSQRLYNELAQKIRTKYKDEPSSVKWLLLIKAIKDLFAEMDSGSQKSKQDVKSTMEAILEPLEIMAFKMQDPKQKSFVIADFFKRKNQCKLILDNIPEYEKSLTPLFTAFVACMSQVHTSLPDSKTDFTLYALDEYLSFAQIMDEPSKKRLHTLIRSKGGILMPAVQYIPKDDKKLQQLLTSSAYAWIYFSVIEEETIKLFKDAVSETEYVYFEKSHSKGESGSSTSTSTKNERVNLINNHLLNGLGTKYEHICYIPNEKVLYLGYTPQANLPKKAEKSVPSDLSEFYAIKYRIDNEEQEDYKNLTFADLFKEKPLSKLEEYKLFKKFEKAKRQGEEAMASFKQAEKLEAVNLELLFSKYMEDKQVVSNKMKMYSIQQRFELFHSYRKIKDDDAAALEFIEKHNLFGALPSFFTFNEEDLGEVNL
ncbi:MAG: type IV secretion system DNA-binding domain-containing protein, partial [Sulfurimonas sp.]